MVARKHVASPARKAAASGQPARTAEVAKVAKVAKVATKAVAAKPARRAGARPDSSSAQLSPSPVARKAGTASAPVRVEPGPAAGAADAAAGSRKPAKPRSKPVRDSFTMPVADFALIASLKTRALAARRETRKSELLRAGLHALAAMDDAALLAALGRLEPVKTGRPKKGH